MKVLLSIKPEFANLIFDGTKKFEFRKVIFKKNNIKTIVVYASSPIQKVIGEFEIHQIIYEQLDCLWEETKHYAGIDEDFFYQYFAEKKTGYAIEIKNPKKYALPLCLREVFNLTPPQSFLYLK